MSASDIVPFWVKPLGELGYNEKLRRGICPECNNEGVLVVETDYEYVKRPDTTAVEDIRNAPMVEMRQYFTTLRCSKCRKAYLPEVLKPMAERFT